jgi:hypothetical protein
MISPRSLFQSACKEEAKKLDILSHEVWFGKCVTYARAQLAADGLSAERLAGANAFIEVLTTLADEQKPLEGPPDKQLKTYG